VEIDPVVVELAERHFYFTPDEGMRVYVEDGRAFLRRNPDLEWDAIILDAFNSGGRLPFHLMTQEFLESVKAHLTPDGVVLANLPSALAGEAGSLFHAEYRTFREVFNAVYVFPRHDPAEQDANSQEWWQRMRNVFVAVNLVEPRSKAELLAQAERFWGHLGRDPHRREETELFYLKFHAVNLLEQETLEDRIDLAGERMLTNDYAPVDTLVFENAPTE
jgi:hypothetical protein